MPIGYHKVCYPGSRLVDRAPLDFSSRSIKRTLWGFQICEAYSSLPERTKVLNNLIIKDGRLDLKVHKIKFAVILAVLQIFFGMLIKI